MTTNIASGNKVYTNIDYDTIYLNVVNKYDKNVHQNDYKWYMNYSTDIVNSYLSNNAELSDIIIDDYGYMNSVRDYENDGMIDVYFFDENNVSKKALASYLINRVFINAYAIQLEMLADDEDLLSDTDTIYINSDDED
jgi:hypothetical protein|tara:strand:- start:516 stop:929 length:414 start_codon:yes stop_codon:yes gene_type:complete